MKTQIRRRAWNVRTLAMLLVPLLGAGCADLSRISSFRDASGALAQEMDRRERSLAALARELPPDDPARGVMLAAASGAGSVADAARAASRQAGAIVDRARDPALAGELGEALTTLLPPPFRAPALFAGALALSLVRWWRLRRAADSIVTSVNAAMIEDETLRDAFRRNANVLRSVQTPAAKRLVDRVNRGAGVRIMRA